MNGTPDSRARNCLIPKYIGTDFDHVVNVSENIEEIKHVSGSMDQINLVNSKLDKIKAVADNINDVGTVAENIDDIKDLASFVGKTEDHLITNMLKTEGYSVVGNATSGCLVTDHQDLVVHQGHIFRYIGTAELPIRVTSNTNFFDGSWAMDSFRGSVQDWNTFDRQLLDAGDLPSADLNEPDTDAKPSRLNAITNYIKKIFYKIPFLSKGSTTARSLEDRFSDVVNVKDFITSNSVDQTPAMQNVYSRKDGYAIPKGVSFTTVGTFPEGSSRVNRPFTGGYEYKLGQAVKYQKQPFGTFDDAAVFTVYAGQEDKETATQILGTDTGSGVAAYGNIDTASMYIQNFSTPAVLESINTTYTDMTVTATDLDATKLKYNQVLIVMISDVKHYAIIKSWTDTTITTKDGFWKHKANTQVTPPNGSKLLVSPQTRIWTQNNIVTIEEDGSAESGVAVESQLNLRKKGTGKDSQIYKGINNNYIGEQALSCYEAVGLFKFGGWFKQGCATGVQVENSVDYGFRTFQNGDSFGNNVAFEAGKVSSATFGSDVAFRAVAPRIAFQAKDAVTRAFQVTVGGNERMYIGPTGKITQILADAEGTLTNQFGINANAGLSLYQTAGTGALYDATVRVGKHSITNRSINAAGTINASGSDYAEYMVKSDNCGKLSPGDICGIDSSGMLTDKFSESISFIVKSTKPSFVGGAEWFSEDMPDREEAPDLWDEWEKRHQLARAKVDRMAFCGQVPVNVSAKVGDYIIPTDNNGLITGEAVSKPTFEQYQNAIGKVIKVVDGVPIIIIKIA